MAGANVRSERTGNAVLITVERPEALNALDQSTIAELTAAVAEASRSDAPAIVLTGKGERAFVAGADISEMAGMDVLQARDHARKGHALTNGIASSPKVTIAAINGYALGGGLELALACDLRLACPEAQLGLPEVTLAVIPGFGGTQRLPRIIGEARAKWMILTGERVKAEQALAWGLVHAVVPREKLVEEAIRLSDGIAANGPAAVRLAKESVSRGVGMPLPDALALERELFAACFATRDQKEGMNAFLQKRKPEYEGN